MCMIIFILFLFCFELSTRIILELVNLSFNLLFKFFCILTHLLTLMTYMIFCCLLSQCIRNSLCLFFLFPPLSHSTSLYTIFHPNLNLYIFSLPALIFSSAVGQLTISISLLPFPSNSLFIFGYLLLKSMCTYFSRL